MCILETKNKTDFLENAEKIKVKNIATYLLQLLCSLD